MKRLLILFAVSLFVFTQFSLVFAAKKCDDPSTYRWDPKTGEGECIKKIKEQKCEDPSKYQWDPKTGDCIEKVKGNKNI